MGNGKAVAHKNAPFSPFLPHGGATLPTTVKLLVIMKGFALAAVAAFLWATIGIFAKVAYSYGVDALVLIAIRAIIATLTLAIALAIADPNQLRVRPRHLPAFVVYGVVGTAMNYLCFFYALKYTTVATTEILLYLYPVIVTVAGVFFFKERLDAAKSTALALALVGCFLVAGGYDRELLRLNARGVAWGLGSGVTAAVAVLLGKWAVGEYSPWTTVLYAAGIAAITLAGLVRGDILQALNYPLPAWVAIVCIAWFPTLLAYSLFMASMQYIEAGQASIIATLEPVTAALLAFVILGETLEPLQILGGALVLGAIVILSSRK
ncbi:MAG: hypothetical protein DRI61_04230 [Chloroflexi bacterium]|nr:MAG: hypothetical protein DRI61_04230 [Chloroflexota bacterium]